MYADLRKSNTSVLRDATLTVHVKCRNIVLTILSLNNHLNLLLLCVMYQSPLNSLYVGDTAVYKDTCTRTATRGLEAALGSGTRNTIFVVTMTGGIRMPSSNKGRADGKPAVALLPPVKLS